MNLYLFFLLLSYFQSGHGQNHVGNFHSCCAGQNLVTKGKCVNGESIDLNCTRKIAIDPDVDAKNTFYTTPEGELVYKGGYLVDQTQYCLTRIQMRNSSISALICVSDHDVEANASWFGLRASFQIISIVFLVGTLSVYYILPSLRDLQGKCIMHNITALAFALTILTIIQLGSFYGDVCVSFAFLAYFAFMTTFFWLNVTSFHIWRTVVCPNILGTDNQWYLGYLSYGYGMPTISVVFLLLAHHLPGSHRDPRIGRNNCWFGGLAESWAYFYGPIAILLFFNLVLFISSSLKLWSLREDVNSRKTQSLKFKVRLYVKLFVIMGMTWIFELLSSLLGNIHDILDYVWVVTDYCNTIQGALIFLLLVVLRKRVLRALASRAFFCLNFPSSWKNLIDEEEPVDDVEETTHVET